MNPVKPAFVRMTSAALIALVLGGCSASRRLPETSLLSADGHALDAKQWEATAVEGGPHIHSGRGGVCDVPIPDLPAPADPRKAEALTSAVSTMKDSIEAMMVQVSGPAYGGPDRCLIRLARLPEGHGVEDAVLLMEIPRLAEGASEGAFSPPQLRAGYHSPPHEPSAPLESGTVRVRKSGGSRIEVDATLLFRRAGGPYEVRGRFEAALVRP